MVCFDYEDVELELVVEGSTARLSYLWSDGSIETNIFASEKGTYSAIISSTTCESYVEYSLEEFCPGNLYVPNAFTPDGNSLNDDFATKGSI